MHALFSTERGQEVPTCSYPAWQNAVKDLIDNELDSSLQLAERCAFSLGMVIRYALGLSAEHAKVTIFAGDSLYSTVALSTAHHLLNAASDVTIVSPCSPACGILHQSKLMAGLMARGAELIEWRSLEQWDEIHSIVEASHNVICAMADQKGAFAQLLYTFTEAMNESRIPVHSVGMTLGLDPVGSRAIAPLLYSSSTFSLGLPLEAITADPDTIGRHYLADLGWSADTYSRLHFSGTPLFTEQPIIRLDQKPIVAS